jgi:hypothetical protein
LIPVLLGGMASLLPLALYCAYLAVLNYRRHPTLIPGTWDFAGLLFALSGVLCLSGPAILTGLQRWRLFWVKGNYVEVHQAHDAWWYYWLGLFLLYYALIIGVSTLIFWTRQAQTSIYNVELDPLWDALTATLDRLRLKWRRADGHLLTIDPASGERGEDREELDIEVDAFPALHHATLHWRNGHDLPIRATIEAELSRTLTGVETGPGVGTWFATAAVLLFGAVFFVLLLFVVAFLIAQQTYQPYR